MRHVNRTAEGAIFLCIVAMIVLAGWGAVTLIMAHPAVVLISALVTAFLVVSYVFGWSWSDPS